jgi:hypothetical protein
MGLFFPIHLHLFIQFLVGHFLYLTLTCFKVLVEGLAFSTTSL